MRAFFLNKKHVGWKISEAPFLHASCSERLQWNTQNILRASALAICLRYDVLVRPSEPLGEHRFWLASSEYLRKWCTRSSTLDIFMLNCEYADRPTCVLCKKWVIELLQDVLCSCRRYGKRCSLEASSLGFPASSASWGELSRTQSINSPPLNPRVAGGLERYLTLHWAKAYTILFHLNSRVCLCYVHTKNNVLTPLQCHTLLRPSTHRLNLTVRWSYSCLQQNRNKAIK